MVNVKPSTSWAWCFPFQSQAGSATCSSSAAVSQLKSRSAADSLARRDNNRPYLASAPPLLPAMADDPRDGRLAGSFLAVAEHLRQKRPDHDRRGVDAVLSKQAALPPENLLDPFSGENLGERETGAAEKGGDNSLEISAAAARGIWY